MADKIKGIVVQIGGDTSGLSKALSDANTSINTTQKELKEVDKLLKLDPKNIVLLEQKQRLLATSIENTQKKSQALNEAVEKAADSVKNYDAWQAVYQPIQQKIEETKRKLGELEQSQKEALQVHGDSSEAYQEITASISKTAAELKELKKQAKEVSEEFGNPISQEQFRALQREVVSNENALRALETEAGKVNQALEEIQDDAIEDVADAANEAADGLEEAGEKASHFKDHLKAEAIVEGAKAIIGSLKDVAEETKEYQKIMASLETSSAMAGYTAEETAETYRQLFGVLADDQTAATTTANLQALGLSQEELSKLTHAAIGAWAQYGDSIPIDGLAEAINETVKVGQVTGTFADVLNWAGISEDSFNKKLETCKTETGRANLVMKQLAEQGLVEAGEAWRKNNEELVKNNEANAALQQQMAELGELVLPILTKITGLTAAFLEKFNQLSPTTKKIILTVTGLVAAMGTVIQISSNVSKSITSLSGVMDIVSNKTLPFFKNMFTSVFSFIASNPVVLLIAAIVGLVALIATKGDQIQAILKKVDQFLQNIFTTDWKNIFGPVLGGILNGFFQTVKTIWDSIYQVFNGVIDFIRGIFTGDWERAWKGIVEIFDGIFGGLVDLVKAPINGVIKLLNKAIDGINKLIGGLNKIGFDLPDWLGGGSFHLNIKTIGKIPALANGGILSKGTALVGEAGPELLTMTGGKTMVQPLTNTGSHTGIDELIAIAEQYLPYLAKEMAIRLDTGELVGILAREMYSEIGRIASRERGR